MKPHTFLKKRNYTSGCISISGPSAVGKSSTSLAVSKALNMNWYDLDDQICYNTGLPTTKEVIARYGHTRFKQIQNYELKKLINLKDKNLVFACGGEIVRPGYDENVIKENRDLIKNNTYNICLLTSDNINEIVEVLYPRLDDGKRDTRTNNIEEFKNYIEPSINQYFELADLIVFVHDADVETVKDHIIKELKQNN